MLAVKTWDTVIIGAGIIGLSLALELRRAGMSVLVVEKGQPGREASWAAGGMLVDFFLETPQALNELAAASARMYPEFVKCLEAESGLQIDFRSEGAIVFLASEDEAFLLQKYALPAPLGELEPSIKSPGLAALFLQERSVDPQHLTAAAVASARNLGVDFSSDDAVEAVEIRDRRAAGVRTSKTRFSAGKVVNCAGAWAGQIAPHGFPARPVKGQMLCVAMPHKELVRHVVRAPDVYLIPRSNGHMVIGATVEEAGFDKRTLPEAILKLRNAAVELVPKLAEARILDDWAGLRPGTPDKLPILGKTSTPGYFVATGHFRDGILLAPITARVMARVVCGKSPEFDLGAFRADRFARQQTPVQQMY
jgi:glycine oxidase